MSFQHKEKPDTLVLFDVDGTLTPARLTISPEFKQLLADLRKKVVIGFVGGSDLQKQVEDHESKRQKLLKIQGYLQRMESEFHCPIPKNLKELEMLRLTLRKASSLSK
jgi:hypothetical protein